MFLTVWTFIRSNWILFVIVAAVSFAGGIRVEVILERARSAVEQKAIDEAKIKAQADADIKAAAWEKQLAELRANDNKIIGRLKNELKNTVYSTCIVPDDGVSIYNDALSGNGPGKSDGSVP